MFIYKIENISNGRVYIGQTSKRLNDRILHHLSFLKRGKHPNRDLQREWSLFGKKFFTLSEIDICANHEELDEKEKYWISFYDSINPAKGFNKTTGGVSSHQLSQETKARIGKAVTREKNGFFKKKHTQESINKIISSKPVKEKKTKEYIRSNECRKAQSEAAFKRTYTEEQLNTTRENGKKMSKPIMCNENGIVYPSRIEMARQLNITRTNISAVIKGKKKSVSGYTFTEMSS